MKLTTTDHSRKTAGLTYVYPVISRRSGGLSIGINLNPNNACNWQCIYCQVTDLTRGSAPDIDLCLLEQELRYFLDDVLEGDFYQRFQVIPAQRNIRDIAISGNGEPTSARNFDTIITLVDSILKNIQFPTPIKRILITNGSLIHQTHVQRGLKHWAAQGGEIWFKLDAANDTGIQRINQGSFSISRAAQNLNIATRLCPTWIQTCVFQFDGQPPSTEDCQDYLNFLSQHSAGHTSVQGVLLYNLARPSMQTEANHLTAVTTEWIEAFASQIRTLKLEVRVSA